MWFISYKDLNKKDCFVNKIFENRLDAFRFINTDLNRSLISEINVVNGDLYLINSDITEGTKVQFCLNNSICNYGVIEEVSEHLVYIRKLDGDIAEFTKGKINKEYVKGVLSIT